MENRRFQIMDRRQNKEILKVPFKDCNGATITGNRREITSRRIDVLELVYLLEDDIDLVYFDEFVIR